MIECEASAVDLTTEEWADVPIVVSEWIARSWVGKFGCSDPTSMVSAHLDTQPEHHAELTESHGLELRRNVSLGFVGYRAAEKHVSESGVILEEPGSAMARNTQQ